VERLSQATRLVARAGSWFGGALILASAFIVTADVLMRKIWSVTVGGADLLAGFALAIGSAWGFGFAFLNRAHIRIDTLYVRMPAKARLAADFIGIGLMIAFFGMVTWYAFGVLEQSIRMEARAISALQVPVAIPQTLWVAGLIFFLFTMLLTVVRALDLLRRGRARELQQLIGSKTADEEVAEERATLTGV